MNDLPQFGDELLVALDRLTDSGAAIWLCRADSPGHIYCYVAEERVDFLVYVDADTIGSPSGEVAAVSAVFRNIEALYLQPDITAPRLLDRLRSATDSSELFRRYQRESLRRAVTHLRNLG